VTDSKRNFDGDRNKKKRAGNRDGGRKGGEKGERGGGFGDRFWYQKKWEGPIMERKQW